MVSNTSDTVYGENHWKVLISKMKKIKDHPPSNVPWFLKSQRCKTGFPGGSVVKSLPAKQETRVWSLGREDPPEKEWQPTLVFLPGESHGRRSLVGYSPWGHKESDTTEQLHSLTRLCSEYITYFCSPDGLRGGSLSKKNFKDIHQRFLTLRQEETLIRKNWCKADELQGKWCLTLKA